MIYISFMGFLAWVIILSLFSVSALYLIVKNNWDTKYQLHRKGWMPNWCESCSTIWLSVIPAIIAAAFLQEWPLLFGPILVLPIATLLHRKIWR